MGEIMDKIHAIGEDFSLFNDPRDKYVYLVDLAKESTGLQPEERIDRNKISGCTSQAWVVKEKLGDQYSFLHAIGEDFSLFNDPRDKYVYLVDLAKESTGLKPEERIDRNKISGCTSQAWVVKEKLGDQYSFRTDSDAMIVKGLLFLIETVFNGHSKEEILTINGNQFLTSVGLDTAISSQRTNGFASAIQKIQAELID